MKHHLLRICFTAHQYSYRNKASAHIWVGIDVFQNQNQLYFSIQIWSLWKRKEQRMTLLVGPEKQEEVSNMGEAPGGTEWGWKVIVLDEGEVEAVLRHQSEDVG